MCWFYSDPVPLKKNIVQCTRLICNMLVQSRYSVFEDKYSAT